MFILTVEGKEDKGAYSVVNETGDKILYLFEEEDDATRYAMQLEDEHDYPEMHIIEVEDDIMLKTCHIHECEYAIISKNDIVVPPETETYDFI